MTEHQPKLALGPVLCRPVTMSAAPAHAPSALAATGS